MFKKSRRLRYLKAQLAIEEKDQDKWFIKALTTTSTSEEKAYNELYNKYTRKVYLTKKAINKINKL